jgi:hypothetical protein
MGDSESATVFALDVEDAGMASDNEPLTLDQIDLKIAARLGTTVDGIMIHDMAVHPASQQVYFSVTRGQGAEAMPVLVRVAKSGEIEEVKLDAIRFSRASISNAPAADATDNRGRSLRTNTITDLAYADGQVYVAGLSNEEFASNFRRLDFPFEGSMTASSLEIFHVAHGQYETHAPVRTFMPYKVGNEAQILAAYTCTPLVGFPINELKDGMHVKGKTMAELGAGNSPLDIIAFDSEGESHILIANSSRTVMAIDGASLVGAKSLTEPITKQYGTAGVDFTALPLVGVLQMDVLNGEQVLLLQRQAEDGSLRLRSYPMNRI